MKLICQNPKCGKEFEARRKTRKYCQRSCQVPWSKGKNEVLSEEARKKRSESLKKYYQTEEGKKKRERLTERNLGENNPWRKGNYSEEWKEEIYEKVRETYKDPEVRKKCAWNSGMSHDEDTIEKMRQKRLDWWEKKGENYRKKYSKKMSKIKKDGYASGKIKIRYGKDAPNWRGGYSQIVNILRSDRRLYEEWKYNILSRDRFKCVKCGNEEELNVHHDKETLSEIYYMLTEDINTDDLAFDEKKAIVEQIVDYHIDNNVSGITLCKKCHKKEHPSYNF